MFFEEENVKEYQCSLSEINSQEKIDSVGFKRKPLIFNHNILTVKKNIFSGIEIYINSENKIVSHILTFKDLLQSGTKNIGLFKNNSFVKKLCIFISSFFYKDYKIGYINLHLNYLIMFDSHFYLHILNLENMELHSSFILNFYLNDKKIEKINDFNIVNMKSVVLENTLYVSLNETVFCLELNKKSVKILLKKEFYIFNNNNQIIDFIDNKNLCVVDFNEKKEYKIKLNNQIYHNKVINFVFFKKNDEFILSINLKNKELYYTYNILLKSINE